LKDKLWTILNTDDSLVSKQLNRVLIMKITAVSNTHFFSLLSSLILLFVAGLFTIGCDTQSGDNLVRQVGVDYSSLYSHPNGTMVEGNTGKAVTQMDLRQLGDQLEAVDNNGLIYRGTIGRVVDDTASFTLRGATTTGQDVTIVGSLQGSGTTSVMSGDWVEELTLGILYGEGTIEDITNQTAGNTDDTDTGDMGDTGDPGTGNLSVSPSGDQTAQIGATLTFSASNGSGTYAWSISNPGIGTLSAVQGTTTSYSATGIGSQSLTITDGNSTERITITTIN